MTQLPPSPPKTPEARGPLEAEMGRELSRSLVAVLSGKGGVGKTNLVANLLLDGSAPPLAWIGDGQRVPDDLRVPDPTDLAQQVLGAPA